MSPETVNILSIIKVQTGNQLDGSAPGLQLKWTETGIFLLLLVGSGKITDNNRLREKNVEFRQ